MKNLTFLLITFFLVFSSCNEEKPMKKIIDESLSFAVKQYSLMYDVMKDQLELLPRTTDKAGNLLTVSSGGWTSGFFPGSLWYLYEYSKDEKMKEAA